MFLGQLGTRQTLSIPVRVRKWEFNPSLYFVTVKQIVIIFTITWRENINGRITLDIITVMSSIACPGTTVDQWPGK